MSFTTIPTKYDDQYRRTVILYGNKTDNVVYADETKKEKISAADLEELFYAGVTVLYDDKYYTPVSFAKGATYSSVTICKEGSTGGTVTLQELKSEDSLEE